MRARVEPLPCPGGEGSGEKVALSIRHYRTRHARFQIQGPLFWRRLGGRPLKP